MILAVCALLFALFVLGWLVLSAFEELGWAERAGLAYGIGAAGLTWVIFITNLLGVPITLLSAGATAVLLVAVMAGLLWQTRRAILPSANIRFNLNAIQIFIIGLISITILVVFARALYMPPYVWDSLAIWALKGKLIAATGNLTLLPQTAHPFYPLNIPLQLTFLFQISEDYLQIVFPVYLLSLVLIVIANLQREIGTTLSLACGLFLCVTPIAQFQSTIAYANLPFGFYYTTSAIYLYRYLKERETAWLVLSSLLVGFAGWTRTEVLLYFAVNLIVLVLLSGFNRKTIRHAILYTMIYAILWMPWSLFIRIVGYRDYTESAYNSLLTLIAGQTDPSRWAQIGNYILSRFVDLSNWGLAWTILPIALLLGMRRLREHAPLLALLGLNLLGLSFAMYSTSGQPLDFWLVSGFDRYALQWMPLGIFYLGLAINASSLSKVDMLPSCIRNEPYLILLILFSLFAIGPLLAPGYFWGAHDGRHSVYFLFEFDRSIQDGIFYPRWAPDYTFGYGYPMFNIYAPGALYVSEAFHLLGFDFVTATKIVFALAILLSGPAMFGLVKRLTGSSQAAFVSGVAYVYIPYHIADIYVRAALAESVALIFLPLTLWGFHETVVRPNRVTIVATAMAYAAMMFSHNGLALMFTPILAIWVLFLMLGELRGAGPLRLTFHVSRFIRLGLPSLAAFALGVGLVAIFLIPAVLEYPYVRTDQWLGNYYDYTHHFAYFFQFFSPTWGFGISQPGPRDEMSFQLGVVPVTLAILSLVALVKNPRNTRRIWIFFAAMAVIVSAMMLSASLPLWQVLRPILSFAQFPWRLLTLTMIPLSVLASAIVVSDEAEEGARANALPTILLGALLIFGSYPYLTAQMILEPKEGPVSILGLFRFQQSAGEMTGSTAWVKEIPTWSPMADVYFAGKKLKSKIDYTHVDPDKVWIGILPNFAGFKANGEQIVYHAQEDTTITFNTFYYPGWRAYLTKPKTMEIIRELKMDVAPDDVLGRIRVYIPKGQEQWLLVRFDDTLPRVIGGWVSAASILIALGVLAWDVRTKAEGRRMKDER